MFDLPIIAEFFRNRRVFLERAVGVFKIHRSQHPVPKTCWDAEAFSHYACLGGDTPSCMDYEATPRELTSVAIQRILAALEMPPADFVRKLMEDDYAHHLVSMTRQFGGEGVVEQEVCNRFLDSVLNELLGGEVQEADRLDAPKARAKAPSAALAGARK